jgi:hypothetical protein
MKRDKKRTPLPIKSKSAYEHEQRALKIEETRNFLEGVAFFDDSEPTVPEVLIVVETKPDEGMKGKKVQHISDVDFYRTLDSITISRGGSSRRNSYVSQDEAEGDDLFSGDGEFLRGRANLKRPETPRDTTQSLDRTKFFPNVVSTPGTPVGSGSLASSSATLQVSKESIAGRPPLKMLISSATARWNTWSESEAGTAVSTPFTLFEDDEGTLGRPLSEKEKLEEIIRH